MKNQLNIKVIIGSTREKRFGEKPAQWIFEELKKHEGITAELLDLRDYPLPFFNEPLSPGAIKEPYSNPIVQKWTAKIAEADAFIMVTPEYNHGPSAVLKNAIDYVGKEWNKKAIAFVSYGSVGGARAVEQLRLIMIELQMAPIRASIYLPSTVYASMINETAPVKPELFDPVKDTKDTMLTQLIWWADALKTARNAG